jgi:hypothetical protein
MDKNFNLGYNEGLTTAVRYLTNLSNDLKEFGEADVLDSIFLMEIAAGLKELFLDMED